MLDFGRRKLPVLIQAEAAECGLCCIGMVAGYYGNQIDMVMLRRTYGVSMRGATLAHMMHIAEDLALSPRPLQVGLEELSQLRLPAVLHWNLNHFVTLAKVGRNHIIIHDPAVGERRYSLTEASHHFTGVALELAPRQEFKAADDRDPLRLWSFWSGTRGLGKSLAQIFALSLMIQAFSLATPFYMQIVVDDVLIKHDADLLVVLALGFLALTLISVATKAVRGYVTLYLVNQLNYNLGNSVLHHLIRLPMQYFEKRHMGDIVSRFSSIKPIQEFFAGGLIAVAIDGLLALTTLALMIVYAPILAVVVVSSVLIYAIFRLMQFRPLRNANHEYIAADAKLDSIYMESIRAIQGIKLAGRELERQNRWRNQFAQSINANARVGRLTISYEAANNTLTGCEYVLVIFLGAQLVLDSAMSVGMLYAFMAYRSNFSNAVVSIINQFIQYRMLGLHLERLSDITQTDKEPGLEVQSTLILPLNGDLEARDISFRYAPADPYVFSGLDLAIPRGARVAVFGPSGAGKTTLIKVLMGLLQPTAGELLIDGLQVSAIGQKNLRHHVAAVMQDDVLFSGSIKDNVAFFDLAPDSADIKRACELACVHDDIMQTPMGYDSLIGDMGSTLSFGQQQRVLLARALCKNPKILFLDEGTAHVDGPKETQIMKNLCALDLTCVYVTHNPNLLDFATSVVTWEADGSIVQTPTESKQAP